MQLNSLRSLIKSSKINIIVKMNWYKLSLWILQIENLN